MKQVKGRWACLFLDFRFYLPLKTIQGRELTDKADYLYFDKADETSAFSVYQQAAQQGSNSAMASLAKMWAMGRSTGVGKNMRKRQLNHTFKTNLKNGRLLLPINSGGINEPISK